MPFFKRKVKVVDAEQFNGTITRGVCSCYAAACRPHVHTMHADQLVLVESGDWIIREPDGEHFYPVKPEVFTDNYEPFPSL